MCWPFPQIIINTCRVLGKVNEWEEGHSLRMQTRATEPRKRWLRCVWKLMLVNAAVSGGDAVKSLQTVERLQYSFLKLSNNILSVCVCDDSSHKSIQICYWEWKSSLRWNRSYFIISRLWRAYPLWKWPKTVQAIVHSKNGNSVIIY